MVDAGTGIIEVISDSPYNQYRHKKIFWLAKRFAKMYKVIIKWIYLEVGHGNGIPEGHGAVVKSMIKHIISLNPDDPTLWKT